jgi:signal transduction histidine kinase
MPRFRIETEARRITPFSSGFFLLILGLLALLPFGWSIGRVVSHIDTGLHIANVAPLEKLDWDTFYNGARILKVAPNSPADRAGLQTGDTLLQINGRSFTGTYQDAYLPFTGAPIDTLVVSRNNQLVTVTMPFPPFNWSTFLLALEPIFVGAIFWLASMACILIQPRQKLSIIFWAGCQAIFWFLVTGALSSQEGPWARVLFDIGVTLYPTFLIHFFQLFLGSPLKRLAQGLTTLVYMALLIQLAAIVLFMLVFPAVPLWGTFFKLSGLWEVVSLSLYILVIFYPNRETSLADLRKRSILIKSATLIMIPGFLFGFLPDRLFGQPILPYVWIEPLSIVLPLGYVYILATNGLAKADRILSSIFLYVLFIGLLSGTFFLSFWGLEQVIEPGRRSYVIAATAIALLEMAVFFQIQPFLRRSIDHLFYGSWYDYRSIVRSSSLEFCRINNLDEWIALLFTTIQAMRFQSALLLWPEHDTFAIKGRFDYPGTPELTLPTESLMIRYLAAFPDMLSRSQLANKLGASDETALLTAQGVNLILPLVSHNHVQAILLLGEQQGGALVDKIDTEILVTVARYAAIAAENIALLDDQRKRLAEMQNMRDELAETQQRLIGSREAERLRLSQDLHDGPIQDLYGARLHLNTLVISDENMMQFAMIQGILFKTADTLRKICQELRPPALAPFGLEPAIRSHIDQIRNTYPYLDFETALVSDGQLLSENIRLALFRVYQEAMMNILKHAQATCITVRFSLSEQQVLLSIADNGKGFLIPPEWTPLTKQGHFGMVSMIERIEALGGELILKSQPGQGTAIYIRVPR